MTAPSPYFQHKDAQAVGAAIHHEHLVREGRVKAPDDKVRTVACGIVAAVVVISGIGTFIKGLVDGDETDYIIAGVIGSCCLCVCTVYFVRSCIIQCNYEKGKRIGNSSSSSPTDPLVSDA